METQGYCCARLTSTFPCDPILLCNCLPGGTETLADLWPQRSGFCIPVKDASHLLLTFLRFWCFLCL